MEHTLVRGSRTNARHKSVVHILLVRASLTLLGMPTTSPPIPTPPSSPSLFPLAFKEKDATIADSISYLSGTLRIASRGPTVAAGHRHQWRKGLTELRLRLLVTGKRGRVAMQPIRTPRRSSREPWGWQMWGQKYPLSWEYVQRINQVVPCSSTDNSSGGTTPTENLRESRHAPLH